MVNEAVACVRNYVPGIEEDSDEEDSILDSVTAEEKLRTFAIVRSMDESSGHADQKVRFDKNAVQTAVKRRPLEGKEQSRITRIFLECM